MANMFVQPLLLFMSSSAVTNVNNQSSENNALPFIIIVACIIAVILFIACISLCYSHSVGGIRRFFSVFHLRRFLKNEKIKNTMEQTGFTYDPRQDIFYSMMNPWQRNFGYCRLYDEGAAPLSMIIDCEPVYFEYDHKKWLIEFWKGQYGITTGGEIGVFNTEKAALNIPGLFNGTFYESADNQDLLSMSFKLIKNNTPLLSRSGRHWWLTGFVLGEFSEPSDLKMDIHITFKDSMMCRAFIKGLREAGYSNRDFYTNGRSIRLVFDKPRTPQPFTRTAATDWLTQRKNKLLCEQYQNITGDYNTTPEKIQAVQKQSPKMYEEILHMGKNKQFYEKYDTIKKYLNK